MPDTDEIQSEIRSHISFEDLLQELEDERTVFEFLSAVEGIGREVADSTRLELPFMGARDLGWFFVTWEASHGRDLEEFLREIMNSEYFFSDENQKLLFEEVASFGAEIAEKYHYGLDNDQERVILALAVWLYWYTGTENREYIQRLAKV